VKSVCQQGVQEGMKKGGLDAMYTLPYRVRDLVWSRGGGVRRFRKGPGYFFGDEGGIVLVTHEAEEGGRWGFGGLGGKKWSRSVSTVSAGSEAPGKSGNLCGGPPHANLLAVQRERGVAEDRKSDQCVFLAEAMALKYVRLERFTLLQLRWEGSRRDILANL